MRSPRPPDTVRFRPLRSITRMPTLTLVVDPEPTTLVTLTNPADPSLLTEGLLTYDFELNPATGDALVNQPGPRLPYFTLGGWPYAQYLNFRSSELALSINHHGRWVMTKYLIAAAAGAALVILAMNWVTKLEAAASHTMVVAQSRSITHDGMVDRLAKVIGWISLRRQPAEGCLRVRCSVQSTRKVRAVECYRPLLDVTDGGARNLCGTTCYPQPNLASKPKTC